MTTKLDTAQLRQLDQAHYLHPFTNLRTYSQHGGRIISRAEHVYIYDSDENKLLDGMSGLWCCNLGYSQSAIKDAVYAQLQELPYYNNFFQCANEPAVELARALVEVTPAQFNHVFFTNSGSEANDTNLRLVHRYYNLLGQPEKNLIISRKNAYHGSTIASASLGGMGAMHKQMQPLDYVHHINQPHWFAEGGDEDPNDYGIRVARELEQKIDELGEARVAAFIAEPVQGAGGVIIPPDSYWPEIKRICQERDILLIMDEVICGFGRTGNWFGCQTYGLEPDLMTFAKAVTNGYLPLGGVMVGDKVADVLLAHDGEFAHGLTYSGHPAACAAGLATLNILRKALDKAGDHERIASFTASIKPLSVIGLLATVVLLFGFQAQTILAQPLVIVLIAIPLIIQSYGIFIIAYGWAYLWRVPFDTAAPAALIGTSNFFELAVAVAIGLFGLNSGAALATVVGVLVEVPVMLSLVAIANRTQHRFAVA